MSNYNHIAYILLADLTTTRTIPIDHIHQVAGILFYDEWTTPEWDRSTRLFTNRWMHDRGLADCNDALIAFLRTKI